MTEQERAIRDEGTLAYFRLCERIVREDFGALDNSGSTDEGGFGSECEAAEADLKNHLDLWELEGALNDTEKLLDGFWHAANAVNPVAMLAISDAQQRTRAELRRVQAFINAQEE